MASFDGLGPPASFKVHFADYVFLRSKESGWFSITALAGVMKMVCGSLIGNRSLLLQRTGPLFDFGINITVSWMLGDGIVENGRQNMETAT